MKNQSRTEIIAAILEVINRGESTKAKIMYALSILYTIKWKHIFSAWDGYDGIPKEHYKTSTCGEKEGNCRSDKY